PLPFRLRIAKVNTKTPRQLSSAPTLNNLQNSLTPSGAGWPGPSATFEGNPQVDDILCPWRTPVLPLLHAPATDALMRLPICANLGGKKLKNI
ncbi:MAG: hypothetical protein MZV65_01545, partial [Chromatiales bacterium]|nr:hypothetical protein [Chromatiales bacterium]